MFSVMISQILTYLQLAKYVNLTTYAPFMCKNIPDYIVALKSGYVQVSMTSSGKFNNDGYKGGSDRMHEEELNKQLFIFSP